MPQRASERLPGRWSQPLIVTLLCVHVASLALAQQASAPAPPSGGKQAGDVVTAIPDNVVDRQGAVALPLKTSDSVYWQDVVRTLDQGRVRIRLLDSSLLNVGVRSSMRIVQHDPQSQQTQLELSFGHLRGEVKSLTKSGGKFEIQTPTAVIGVVGTVLEVDATEKTTRIHVIEGRVKVRNRNPKVKGETGVREGDETHVDHSAPPARPIHTPEYKKERQEAIEHRKAERQEKKKQQAEQKRQQKAERQEKKNQGKEQKRQQKTDRQQDKKEKPQRKVSRPRSTAQSAERTEHTAPRIQKEKRESSKGANHRKGK